MGGLLKLQVKKALEIRGVSVGDKISKAVECKGKCDNLFRFEICINFKVDFRIYK
jgi:hypothetical protein